MVISFLEICKLKLRPLPKATKVSKSYMSSSEKQDLEDEVQLLPGTMQMEPCIDTSNPDPSLWSLCHLLDLII